jgi:solute:Na+ symporter, SSS family
VRALDWAVLAGTLGLIVAYGLWRARAVRTADEYLSGGRDFKWWTIGISIMATQASAITFLSLPGQAYEDGLRFVQFYFGLPVAMVLLCATIVPVYYRLRVTTAYEYLETRFDRKTRQLTGFLFLVGRGLGAGLSIYAPAIILSTVLGWPLQLTNLVIGVLVIAYTVSGGTRAVSQTQVPQMAVMLGGMALALVFVLRALPAQVGFGDALAIAGSLDRMSAVDFSLRLDTRYTFWSGLTGGLFVALAYFGTDQSQVQRYLGGETLAQTRLGLLLNGLVKIPMQLFILLVGLMVLVFYQFHQPPVFFQTAELERARATAHGPALARAEARFGQAFWDKQAGFDRLLAARRARDPAAVAAARAAVSTAEAAARAARADAKRVIQQARPRVEPKDADYVFVGFITRHFPPGLVGLLLAVIFVAAMSATASALNALGSTTVVDFYRTWRPARSDAHYLQAGRIFTVGWGVLAMSFAAFASLLDNLIQAVNILGSIFYGPMLGVFLVAFFLRRVGGTAVFVALIVAQVLVVLTFALTSIGFLWYNVIGCAAVVGLALLLSLLRPASSRPASSLTGPGGSA